MLDRLYGGWRKEMIEAQALVEAAIDFADEGDVATRRGSARPAADRTTLAVEGLTAHLGERHTAARSCDRGFKVVLAGPPNAGKSSLLNALARRDAAIVSDEPGTTRDVIEVRLDLGGIPVVVSDTAGIREATARSSARASAARLVRARRQISCSGSQDLTDGRCRAPAGMAGRRLDRRQILVVDTKADLAGYGVATSSGALRSRPSRRKACDDLIGEIVGRCTSRQAGSTTRSGADQRSAIASICGTPEGDLEAFIDGAEHDLELRAEDLRLAASELGRLVGRIDPEEVLGAIFGRFCIGK